jgi:hypothetical protein
MAKQSVAIKEEKQLALPDFMKEEVGLGTEALGAADVEVPRVKLIQALSPELQEYNELKQGHFWHTLAELDMGPQVRVTPIYIDNRFILWRPQDSGGGILARADDGVHWNPPNASFTIKLKGGAEVTWRTAPTVLASGLDRWGSTNPADPNSPPAATRMYNMVVTFPDMPDLPPAVITLQRSAIKVARRFIGKLKITRAPSFGLIFQMSATEDRNSAGQKFFNYAFKADGMVEDQGTYTRNREYYHYFKEQGIQVKDLESAQEDAEAGEPDDGKF